MALKIISSDGEDKKEIEKSGEPYVLGTLTSWGNLDVGILEEKHVDNYICLENKHEMLEAYIKVGELNGQI